MSIVGFPLLLIPLAIANIIAFLMPGVALGSSLFAVPLLSGATWTLTFSDALIALAMLLLFFEVAKTARPGGKYLTDHLLSMLLCGAAAAEFLLLPQFGNSTMFLLTFLTFVDVISGIAIRMRQRGFVEAQPRPSRRTTTLARPEPAAPPAEPAASPPQHAQDAAVDLQPGEPAAPGMGVGVENTGVENDRPLAPTESGELASDRPQEPHR